MPKFNGDKPLVIFCVDATDRIVRHIGCRYCKGSLAFGGRRSATYMACTECGAETPRAPGNIKCQMAHLSAFSDEEIRQMEPTPLYYSTLFGD